MEVFYRPLKKLVYKLLYEYDYKPKVLTNITT